MSAPRPWQQESYLSECVHPDRPALSVISRPPFLFLPPSSALSAGFFGYCLFKWLSFWFDCEKKRKLWLLEFPVHNPHTFDPTHITRAGFRPRARGSVGGKVIHVPGCQSNRSYRLHHNLDSAVGHQFWNLTPRERSAFTFPSNPSCSQVPLDYTSACNISVLSPSAKTKPALVRKQIPFLKQASSSFTAVALYFFIFAGSDRVGGARLSQRGRFCFLAPKREDEIWLNLATLGTSHPAVESKDDTPDNQVHTCCELIYKICSVGLLKNYSH